MRPLTVGAVAGDLVIADAHGTLRPGVVVEFALFDELNAVAAGRDPLEAGDLAARLPAGRGVAERLSALGGELAQVAQLLGGRRVGPGAWGLRIGHAGPRRGRGRTHAPPAPASPRARELAARRRRWRGGLTPTGAPC